MWLEDPGTDRNTRVASVAMTLLDTTRATAFLDLLEARLGESRFLALDTFSLADIAAFVFVDFARVIRLRIPETHTATRAWFDAIQARPSAQL